MSGVAFGKLEACSDRAALPFTLAAGDAVDLGGGDHDLGPEARQVAYA